MSSDRQFAVVTGASTGIGFELARYCAKEDLDLLIAADEPAIMDAAKKLSPLGVNVEAVQADLGTGKGCDKLYGAIKGRQVDAPNAGRGLGRAFVEQDFAKIQRVIDTNVTGTVYLVHKVANDTASELRSHPHHRLDRRVYSGQFSGRL
jgi:short-subunit dehydrogenase